MKRSFKKLTAWLCCMAMLISFIPATALPVFAAEATAPTYTEVGDSTLTVDDFAETNAVKLTANATVESKIELKGSGKHFYLDLNGFELTSAANTAFSVGATLTILDSSEGQAGKIIGIDGGSANIGNDGLILVSGTLNLESGTLIGRKTTVTNNAGGVRVCGGTFNMNGGAITGGSVGGNGGAIFANDPTATVYSVININGGKIYGNTAAHGGGIFAGKDVVVNIEDGEIYENTATNRGGAIATHEMAKCNAVINISGGKIYNNITASNGATLHGYESTYNIMPGADIDVGTKSGAAATGFSDQWIRGCTVNITGGTMDTLGACSINAGAASVVNISGAPTIGAVTIAHGQDAAGTANANKSTMVISKLTSGASVKCAANYTSITTTDAGVAYDSGTKTYSWNDPANATALAGTVAGQNLANGYYKLSGDVYLAGRQNVAAGTGVVIDLNGYTITYDETLPAATSFFNVTEGGALTIEDSSESGTGEIVGWATTGCTMIQSYGAFTLAGGKLSGWERTDNVGGALYIVKGTFDMTGGEISGNAAKGGTGNCQAIRFGAGTTFNMSGGTITNNNGGTAVVLGGTTFTMTGGTIKGNKSGGADLTVGQFDVNATTDADVVNISGGEIGHLYMTKGAITVSGTAVINNLRIDAATTTSEIKALESGASINTQRSGVFATVADDGTIAVKADDEESTAAGNLYTFVGDTTFEIEVVQPTGGTVTATPTSGKSGTVVTLTNEAETGYEFVEYLVDGEAIEGDTFTITNYHEVSATFAAVDVSLPTSGPVTAGTFVLEGDHVLAGTLTFAGDTTIDLAGHTISMADGVNSAFFTIAATGKLTIMDSSEGDGLVQFKEMTASGGIGVSGEFVLAGGTLDGWTRKNAEGALQAGGFIDMLASGATVTMTGGIITGVEASSAAIIRSHAAGVTVNLLGGEIVENNSGSDIINLAKTGAQSYLNIGGEMVIAENTVGGNAPAFNQSQIVVKDTIVTIEEYPYIEANIEVTLGTLTALEGSQINISGAPYVKYIRADSSAKTLFTIGDLEDGAEIHTTYGFAANEDNKDETVMVETWVGESGNANDKGNIYTWRDPETVYAITVGEVANGTVTVDPTEGLYGATVTVTAEAAEGFELTGIYVDGKKLDGETFTITGDHEVTATFAEIVVEPEVYTVTVGECQNGTVSVSPVEGVAGTVVTVTATPADGYELTTILVDGEAIEGNTFEIEGNHVVTATFTLIPVEEEVPMSLAQANFDAPGTIKLTGTGTLTEAIAITVAGEYVLDLNGYTLSGSAAPYFTIGEGVTLTVTGEGEIQGITAEEAMILVNGGTFVLESGKLTGHNNTKGYGGAIRIATVASSVVTINGGEISGNYAVRGAGIAAPEVAPADPCAVTININDGVITGNTADRGGANLYTYAGATVNIAGGEITDGSATSGGDTAEIWMRSSNVFVTGGTIDNLYFVDDNGTDGVDYMLDISGDPVIDAVLRAAGAEEGRPNMINIHGLTAGANIIWVNDNGNRTAPVSDATALATEGTRGELKTITYTPAKQLPTSGVVDAGEYTLAGNLTLSDALKIESEVTIDLNGYTITSPAGKITFDILTNDTAHLTLKDGKGGGKVVNPGTASNPAVFVQKGAFTLDGGEITGWTREGGPGGMIFVQSGATFTMNGGKLTGAKCAGMGVAIRMASGANVTIAGGEISGNTSTTASPIVVPAGANFTMTGGAIKDNTGANGGAIWAYADITISGGEISGNTADGTAYTSNSYGHGGAIYVQPGASVTVSGDVVIKDNVAMGNSHASSNAGYGGGIYLPSDKTAVATAYIQGGTISGNSASRGGGVSTQETSNCSAVINISGGVIENNHAVVRGANVFSYDAAVNITGGTIGAAVYGAKKANAAANFQNTQFRGGTVTISGGNLSVVDMESNSGSTYGTLTITGEPNITTLLVKDGQTVTSIGQLTGDAYVKSNVALTLAENDDTVAALEGNVYRCAQTVGNELKAENFVDGETLVLDGDRSVGTGIVLPEGSYTIDLNGHTLSGTGVPYFTVGEGVELYIEDSSDPSTGKMVGLTDANHAMILVNGGYFELNGGLLTGNTNTNGSSKPWGGAISAQTAGSFVCINGGEISGNTAHRGGAISGPETGTAIDVTIAITGGIVTGNASDRGATIYTQTGATVIIEGGKVGYGTIKGDTAASGASGYEDLWIRNSVVEVYGGDIGALYINAHSTNKETGEITAITGSLTISGSTKIGMLNGAIAETATIGALESGARVTTAGANALTVEDDGTVSVSGKLYRFAGDVKSILFVGNSFSGDTCEFLTALGAHFGKEVYPAYLYVGSQTIRNHAQSLAESKLGDLNGDGVVGDSRMRIGDGLYTCAGFEGYVEIPTVMEAQQWDYVVLQPGVQYVGYEGTYNSDIDFLIDYIRDVQGEDVQIFWNQTWAADAKTWQPKKGTETNVDTGLTVGSTTSINDGSWLNTSSYLTQFGGSQEAMYDAILRNTDKFIVGADARFGSDFAGWFPIGIAVQNMRDVYTTTTLTRDGFHLSGKLGRMIAGLTVMKTLFGDEIDLTTLTAEQLNAITGDGVYSVAVDENNKKLEGQDDYRKDFFDGTQDNWDLAIKAVSDAYACVVNDEVPAYDDGTANKQFNPDVAGNYVAVYENVTEMGQLPVRETDKAGVAGVLTDNYASVGAGKIVIYNKDGEVLSEIDELWLENNAGIVLTNRYENLDGTYYIIADPQAPQLAISGSTLYLTFDVKLYTDDGIIVNGGVYFTTSTDGGKNWNTAVKVSDAPMAYGLTVVSDGLLLSVTHTTTEVLKLTAAGAVTNTVELADAGVAEVAFAEVGANTFALTSNGAMYVSADKGVTWNVVGGIGGTAFASPDLVNVNGYVDVLYATWADEEGDDIYGKIWTIDATDTEAYGWNRNEGDIIAENYTVSTAYAGCATGGQPAASLLSSGTYDAVVEVAYTSGNEVKTVERPVIHYLRHNMTLESSLTINVLAHTSVIGEGVSAVSTRPNDDTDIGGSVEFVVDDVAKSEKVSTYYKIAVPMAAKQMGDKAETVLYDAEGKQVSVIDSFSIVDYANTLLENNKNAKPTEKGSATRTMAVDMLNYGAAAQVYLKYNTDKLVNADLTDTQKAWASAELEIDTQLTNNGAFKPASIAAGNNLSLESTVEVNMLYKDVDIPTAAYGIVTYTDWEGELQTKKFDVVDYEPSPTYNNVKVNTLATADVFALINCKLYDANDVYIEGSEMAYSIASYAYNRNTTASAIGTPIAILTMKLMQFGVSAEKYFNW